LIDHHNSIVQIPPVRTPHIYSRAGRRSSATPPRPALAAPAAASPLRAAPPLPCASAPLLPCRILWWAGVPSAQGGGMHSTQRRRAHLAGKRNGVVQQNHWGIRDLSHPNYTKKEKRKDYMLF